MTALERSEITCLTARQMDGFVTSLDASYRALVEAGSPSALVLALPHRHVARALDLNGAIICPLLYAYQDGEPSVSDLPFLETISRGLERLFEIGRDVVRRLDLAVREGVVRLRRYTFAPRKFFALDYLQNHTARARDPQRVRERILETLAKSMRSYLAWLRDALRLLESRICGRTFAPFVLAPSVRRVVLRAHRGEGLIVLAPLSREGSQPFHILPTANRAWEILERLCEHADADGYVQLPRDYASAFHHTDADNNTLVDDYARLLRHIIPSPTPGTYRLSRAEKPSLKRGM